LLLATDDNVTSVWHVAAICNNIILLVMLREVTKQRKINP